MRARQIIEIRGLIKRLGKNHTVILSTHILQEVQSVCNRILIINKGKIVADGDAEELSYKAAGNRKLVVRVGGSKTDAAKVLRSVPDVILVESMGSKEKGTTDFLVESGPVVDIRKPLFAALAAKNMPILGLKSMDMSLEDVFIKLITDGGQGGQDA